MRINIIRKIQMYFKIIHRNLWNREIRLLQPICKGKGIDVGCGFEKVSDNCIGVDIIGKYKMKGHNSAGMESSADIKSNGDNLNMFKNNELDFVVAKHNLEHYSNPKKVLIEWKRVIKKGGKIGVIVPDDEFVNSIKLDPTHFSRFNRKTLIKLFKDCGLKVLDYGTALPKWSIYCIGEKIK